jgi:hypothetical protein
VAESALETYHDRMDRLENKIELLIQCEADRKADDRALRRYAQWGFWGLISLGGFINWDKIEKAFHGILR